MLQNKTYLVLFALLVVGTGRAQTLKLAAVIDSITVSHPVVKMYNQEIRSMDEAAKGAKSWMPPEFSTGLWMVPYNPSYWKKSDMGNGMGQYMLGGQQMIPNKKKQQADAAYMQTMSSVEKEKKNATLNELVNDAKQFYYEWIILEKKLNILG